MQTLCVDEIEQVHGAALPAIPIVVWKVGAWVAGAAFGVGVVVVANKLL